MLQKTYESSPPLAGYKCRYMNLGASPQLEYWNTGMMGLEQLKTFKNLIFPVFQPIIPLFQHSIIP